MKDIRVKVYAIGHPENAISQTLQLAKAANDNLTLYFENLGIEITIRHDSNVIDLYEIFRLRVEVIKLKKEASE